MKDVLPAFCGLLMFFIGFLLGSADKLIQTQESKFGVTQEQVAKAIEDCELPLSRAFECKATITVYPAVREFK